jgi:hypothetical protein
MLPDGLVGRGRTDGMDRLDADSSRPSVPPDSLESLVVADSPEEIPLPSTN